MTLFVRSLGPKSDPALLLVAAGGGYYWYRVAESPLSPLAKRCLIALEQTLKSPSSLQIVNMTDRGAGRVALITFDAANGYGTLLRSEVRCRGDEHGRIVGFRFGEDRYSITEVIGMNRDVEAEVRRRYPDLADPHLIGGR